MTRAVLFDLDDTLVDQSSAARTAVVTWARELGLDEPAETLVARWTAIGDRHYPRYQRRELTFAEQRRARARDFLPHEDLSADEDADAAFAGYLAHYEAGWTLFDDAVPALRRARAAGLVTAVLTNGEQSQQALKLDLMGLTTEVDALVASSSLTAAKPDPRAFHEACDRVGVTPGEATMVGDSLEHDVTGALAAGLGAVLLDRADAHPDVDVRRVRSLDDLTFSAPDPTPWHTDCVLTNRSTQWWPA